jgi:hypothetical protein
MRRVVDRETAFKAVSALIVVILGTQFVVGFIDTGRRGWPIVAYPMYSTARYDGDRFDDFKVYAALKDGTKVEVNPGEVGMSYWIFHKNVLNPLLITGGYYERNTAARRLRAQSEPSSGNVSLSAANRITTLAAKLAPTIDHYCDESKGGLTRLEVFDSGVAIGVHGPITNLEPEMVAAMDVTCE